MFRFTAACAALVLLFTATSATARVTYGMNGNGTYTGSGTADCNDGTTVSFYCADIAGLNPFASGQFNSASGSGGLDCAAAACEGRDGVNLMSISFEIDNPLDLEAEEHLEERVLQFAPR